MSDTTTPPVNRRQFIARATAVGTAAAVAPVALSACGKKGAASDPDIVGDDDYKPGSGTLKYQLGEEIEGINYPEDYSGPRARSLEPFGDGKTDFSMLTWTIPELDYKTNYYAQHVEEVTGVTVSYTTVPQGDDGVTKVNAIISAGDLPNAIMCGMEMFSLSQVAAYGQQGLLIPLDKLIDENAPHIRDMFDTFPDMRTLYTSPDGRMYAAPSMNDCYHCKTGDVRTWYNSDWLTAVGAEVPTTLDEFSAVMDAFRGYSGKPDNSTLTIASSTNMMALLNFFFGSFCETTVDNLLLENGKVTWIPTKDQYREGIIWLQEQFATGNLDKNVFSATDDQIIQMGDNADGPRFGVTYGYSQGSFSAAPDPANPKNVASIMKPLAPMAGPSGVRTCDWDWYQIGAPTFAITNSCPDPVQMIRWADYQYELSMTISMGRGEQGKGWDYADVGATGIDGQQAVYSVISQGDDPVPNQNWWEWGPFYKSSSQRLSEALEDSGASVEPIIYEAGKAYEPYRLPKEMKVPPLVFDTDQASQIGEAKTNLETALKQGLSSFCTGKTDASKDADWKAFTGQFTSIGVEQYLKTNQEAYDAQF